MGVRAVIFAMVLGCVPVSAQSWESLSSLQGQHVKVVDRSGEERRGVCESVGADAIAIQTGKGQVVSIEKAKVRLVQVKSGTRRVRNIAIGAAIGLAVGVMVDQTLGTYLRNEVGDTGRPAMYLAPIGLFGGIGAALSPYRTVYRVR
jgi:hypothetical protein